MKRYIALILFLALVVIPLGCSKTVQKNDKDTQLSQQIDLEPTEQEKTPIKTEVPVNTPKTDTIDNTLTDNEIIGTWTLYAIKVEGNTFTCEMLKALGVTDEQLNLSFVFGSDGTCTAFNNGEKTDVVLWTKEEKCVTLHSVDNTIVFTFDGEYLIAEEDGDQLIFTHQKTDNNETSKTDMSPASVSPTPKKTGAAYEIVYSKGKVYNTFLGSRIYVIVQIENTGNESLYINNASVDIEDAKGHLVQTRSYLSAYPQVLLPGETALIAESISLDNDPGVNELSVIPHLNIDKAKVQCIRYKVTDESFTNDRYTGLKMTGRVENTTNQTESMVYVVVNLYDANHHGVGQLYTIITDDLRPGEKIGCSLSDLSASDTISIDSIVSYEIFAFPLQFQF